MWRPTDEDVIRWLRGSPREPYTAGLLRSLYGVDHRRARRILREMERRGLIRELNEGRWEPVEEVHDGVPE
jgi:DNA-binding IclR family transcriptional regulator